MKARLPLVVLAAAGATLAAAVVAMNFSHREKRIGRQIKRLYSAADADFARAMGVLLGPAIVDGKCFEILLIEVFQDDLARSRRISLREWRQQPRAEKLWERAASLLGSQM